MDDALVPIVNHIIANCSKVLILVVMDDALVRKQWNEAMLEIGIVLILVVMDDALVPKCARIILQLLADVS